MFTPRPPCTDFELIKSFSRFNPYLVRVVRDYFGYSLKFADLVRHTDVLPSIVSLKRSELVPLASPDHDRENLARVWFV